MASTAWDEGAVARFLLDDVLAQGAVLTGVVLRGGGALSAVHEARQVAGPPLVVKRYTRQWRWKQAKEVHVLDLLNRSGAFASRVPEVVHVDAERAVTVMTRVPGRPLSDEPVTGAAERAVLAEVGALTRRLHEIPQPAFGYLTTHVLDPTSTNRAYMTRQFDKKLAEFADLGGDASFGAHPRLSRRSSTGTGHWATTAPNASGSTASTTHLSCGTGSRASGPPRRSAASRKTCDRWSPPPGGEVGSGPVTRRARATARTGW